MDHTKQIYLFGDQTTNFNNKLTSIIRSPKGPVLSCFLKEVSQVLRVAATRLPSSLCKSFPRFSRLEELVEQHQNETLHPALQQALTTIYHFASFISHCEHNDGNYPDTDNALLVGLCTGSFAAAAIGCCSNISELVPVAIHTVAIAFHTGYQAVNEGNAIRGQTSSSATSWSMIVDGLNERNASQLVQDFSQDSKLLGGSRPWISAISDSNVTISGPPEVLDSLQHIPTLSKPRIVRLPIFVPYHAPHIFDKTFVERIFQQTEYMSLTQHQSKIPTISSSSGGVIWQGNLQSILKSAIEGVLIHPLRWDLIIRGVISHARATDTTDVKIFSIGTGADQSLAAALGNSSGLSEGIRVRVEDITVQPHAQEENSRRDMSKIAIIGMSGRFPEAENCHEFWDLLSRGLDVHKPAPDFHWSVNTHVDLTGTKKNTSATPYGCWLKEPGAFDARFFNMSPREAPQVDPAQRLALSTAYEAMEAAGIVPDATPSTQRDRVGIFYGVTSNDWMETNSAQNIGGNRAFIPGRVNYFFKFSGPSYSIDTACSSSLAAIQLACSALWRNEIDTALAGGTNVLTNPDFTAGLDRGHFLSRTGNCKTFDDEADGYCRGEGVVTLVLKRLEDAIADNDPIHAVILGARTNHSAEAESITRPHIGAQKAIFSNILRDAGVDPVEVSYVEMHGTGTQAGDAGEMSSVLETFAPTSGPFRRRPDQPLHIGSAKANIGHGEAASGASSLAKVLLMMKHNTIPPHCGIKTKLNKKFPTDLKQRQIHIAEKLTTWAPSLGGRKVFVNNFSAAGGNSALLLEDAPEQWRHLTRDPRIYFPVCISAKTASALERNMQNLLQYVDTSGYDELLPALSYTTTARRAHHPHRVVISASNIAGVKGSLSQAITNKDGATRNKSVPKVIFTFTGQGSQYAGMGKALIEANSSLREDLNHLDHLAQRQGFPSFLPVFANDTDSIENQSPTTVQLGTVALEIALARLWLSWGIKPDAVVGHSLGEYAALCISGVLSLADTIYLVGKRAQLLEAHCTKWTHSMLAVKSSLQPLEKVLRQEGLEVACINGPEDIVLAGRSQSIAKAQQKLSDAKIKSTLLKVPFAFHSAQVEPILAEFSTAAHVKFQNPNIPILCPLLGTAVHEGEVFSATYLTRHCREAVNIVKAIEAARDDGIIDGKSIVLEVGPHPVVSGMFKAVLGSQLTLLSSLQRSKDPWSSITTSLGVFYRAGFSVDWQEYQRDYRHQVLQLPAYSWDIKNYWIQYVNDWSLRKGDAVLRPEEIVVRAQEAPSPAPAVKQTRPVVRLESTTVHNVVSERLSDGTGELVVESDICRSDLHPMVQGHKVDGFPLCTPSVYADIALTVGDYLLQSQSSSSANVKIVVAAMSITKALIARPKGPQILRTTVQLKWPQRVAHCKFATVDAAGKVIGEHANCEIRFIDTAKLEIMHVDVPSIKARMAALRAGMDSGDTFLFNKAMIYKMVTALADFDPNYRGLETIILDSNAMEACSTVNFAGIKAEGNFHTHPAFIDALSQVGGFVMNANDKSDLNKEVFVNHGWGTFQILEPIVASKKYSTYVKMRETEGKMWRGNIVIFDGEKVVALFGDIALQGVPRRLLRYILAAEDGGVSSKANAKPNSSNVKPPSQAPSSQNLPNQIPSSPVKVVNKEQTIPTQQMTSSVTASIGYGSKTSTRKDNKRSIQVLQIISEESGIAVDELTDNSEFTDLGVDSLLSMLIISRLNDEMDIQLGTSAFIDLPTVKNLKDFLFPTDSGQIAEEVPPSKQEPEFSQFKNTMLTGGTGQDREQEQSMLVSQKLVARDSESDQIFDQVLQILAEESGIASDELTDDSNFADMGVDSLLSLMIVSRLQEELNIGHDWDSSFWTDCDTIAALRERLGGSSSSAESESGLSDDKSGPSQSPPESSISTPPYDHGVDMGGKFTPMVDSDQEEPLLQNIASKTRPVEAPPASSVVLQGRVRFARRVLFLFPDGSGSAHSYAKLPNVHDDLAIVGLNCPFRRDASSMENCPLDSLVDSYMSEIRKRQPNGPYHLGGWSAGGILAYRAAQKFICESEQVRSLVLIDSPPPKGLDRLPQHFYDHCSAIGLFGAKMPNSEQTPTAPEWLIPHFNATITVLSDYWADPLPEGETPRTSIIWAAESVFDGVKFPLLPPSPDDTEGMKFLTEKRRDLSAGDWSDLFPGDEVTVEVANGADHFSLISEKADILAQFIDRATS